MDKSKYIQMIDDYLEEPNSINKDWVELLVYMRKLLQREMGR